MSAGRADPAAARGPVTVVVSRRARPGRERELEEWLLGVVAAAARFPGHLGAEVFRPVPPDQPDHVLVFRFADRAALAAWDASAERRDWLARVEPLTEGTPTLTATTGLEAWFALPGGGALPVPARWKVAVVTAAVIWVLVTLLTAAAGPVLARMPLPLRSAATVLVLVPLMTWVVMPRVTRRLAGWLYGSRP